MSEQIIYSEIPDERPLLRFFIDNGLEYSEDDGIATDLVKCWKAEAAEGGGVADGVGTGGLRLVGGCVLAKRQGRFICDGIATDPSVRGQGAGERLLEILIEEARRQGAEAVYLVARAPGFFARYGFAAVPREEAPTFFECFSCSQYGKSCHPVVMRLAIA